MLEKNELEFASVSPRKHDPLASDPLTPPSEPPKPKGRLSRHFYTKKEDEYIEFWSGIKTIKEISYELDRTIDSIRSRMRRLNIKIKNKKKFTEKENEYIKENLDKLSYRKIGIALNRDPKVIKLHADILGLKTKKKAHKPWTNEENKKLKEMINNHYTYEEISKELKKSRSSICARRRRMKLKMKKKVNNQPNKWSEEEKLFLINNIEKMNPRDIGKKLGRTRSSIKCMSKKLGLKTHIRINGAMHWKEQEIKRLYLYAGRIPVKETMKYFPGRTYNSILNKIFQLKINWNQGKITIKEMENILKVSRWCIKKHMKKIGYVTRNDRYINNNELIQKIAKSILNDNRSLGGCKATIKHLEACAEGEFETNLDNIQIKHDYTIPTRNASPISFFE